MHALVAGPLGPIAHVTARWRPAWAAAFTAAAMGVDAPEAGAQEPPCAVGPPIPAYAHNDYENPRPLFDALALGYQGVEADFHLVRGALLVAHDRRRVVPERTLEALYLAPLRAWILRCGGLLPDGRPFLLNIEAKTAGVESYRALMRLLRRYRDILSVIRDGRERPGPIQVVLVGWHPPLDALRAERERLVGVQWRVDGRERVPDAPAHLIRLVSVDYGKVTDWDGTGTPPPAIRTMVTRLLEARDAAPGRRARAHNVPVRLPIYRYLLDAGVGLVGTKDLEATHGLLGAR